MRRMSVIDVTEYTDAGCPWAYSASPAMAVLRWRYGEQLRWRIVTIGLAEDPQIYIDRGYTTTRAAIGALSFRRFGMPFLLAPRAQGARDLAGLPDDHRHPPARPAARARGAARAAARLVQHAAAAGRAR